MIGFQSCSFDRTSVGGKKPSDFSSELVSHDSAALGMVAAGSKCEGLNLGGCRDTSLNAVLGSVRNVMSQTPHSKGQRNHRRVTFCEFVDARHDAAVLLQPAKHTFDDITLPVLGTVKQPRQPRLRFTFHTAKRNHRLHPIPVAVPTQRFCVIAFIREQSSAPFTGGRASWA